jgi:oligopeptide/dipeptide ABC transporter ATP-binding protein
MALSLAVVRPAVALSSDPEAAHRGSEGTRPVMEVSNLRVRFVNGDRAVQAVNGLSYTIDAGRVLAIIGESGSGKTARSRAIMGLLPPTAQVSGSVRLQGTEILGLPDGAIRRYRGRDMAMVFQDPARSLNPTMRIGVQIIEAIQAHQRLNRREAHDKVVDLLGRVRLSAPAQRFNEFPHQLSGGMRQRVMIALALACEPKLLITDEATTALDVTTQAQIMDLLKELQDDFGMAVIMISHDLGLAACYADEIIVMYAGQTVERAETRSLFSRVRMPYTAALLDAVPRSILQAPPPRSGSVIFEDVDLVKAKRQQLVGVRRHLQMIFQDPYNSVDPKWRVPEIVDEPLVAAKIGDRSRRRRRVSELLELVGLDPVLHGARHARELSGGQCQRAAIARAVALNPALIICDEAVSSLDVLVQAQILNLVEKLRAELGLSYLFVAHDLGLVKQVSDRVVVMYLGRLCEIGPAEALYHRPMHPYTVSLLAAIPRPDPVGSAPGTDVTISGEPPSPLDPPSGCRFRTRCPRAERLCAEQTPPLRPVTGGPEHLVACHFPAAAPIADDAVAGEAIAAG